MILFITILKALFYAFLIIIGIGFLINIAEDNERRNKKQLFDDIPEMNFKKYASVSDENKEEEDIYDILIEKLLSGNMGRATSYSLKANDNNIILHIVINENRKG